MTYADAMVYLHGLAMFGSRFGLETTQRLAEAAGNPQRRLRFIHVAGTNGKGSTCAMLESIYRAAGFRVGLFTSPHLVSFRERMQVNRQLISEADVARLVQEVIQDQQSGLGQGQPPTLFEFVTVMALRYFAEQRCDLVIWETGLGGRLDATNIVTPLASVITNIALDHQQWLGDTLAKIAAEKAGIIKPKVPVFTGAEAPEAEAVIRSTAEQNHAPFTAVTRALATDASAGAPFALPLPGAHQRRNAALAVTVVEGLQRQLPVSQAELRRGLATVHWAGRFQRAQLGGREFVLDGAHNLDGVQALATALRETFPDQRLALVLGMLADKDWELMAATLAPLGLRFATVRVSSARTLEPALLAAALQRAHPAAQVSAHATVAEALAAVGTEPRVVVAGSLYLIGEALEQLGLATVPGERELNEWQAAR
ncbi:MAG: hypothetical protein B9S33_08045 [Pedosphaera sp. Tous-C6FEB]|nr:MAG: hypothetical protein B9S33_08045 [Pedosphaera sp. Tous-C6FEB]